MPVTATAKPGVVRREGRSEMIDLRSQIPGQIERRGVRDIDLRSFRNRSSRELAQYVKHVAQQRKRQQQFSGATPVDAEAAVAPVPIRNDFIGTYMLSYSNLERVLSQFAMESVSIEGREGRFAYFESAPYPSRQDRNIGPKIESFRARQYRIPVFRFSVRVPMHVDDIDDDLTGGMMSMAAQTGENFGSLIERLWVQILTGATDIELLPEIPLAPDGAGLYATTAFGANRFGVSGGNVVSGTASPTAQDIREQYYEVTARARRFRDTKGQPLLNPTILSQNVTIVHGPALEAEVKEAFKNKFTFRTEGSAGTDLAAAAPSNVILDAGENIKIYNTPRIENSDLFFFFDASPVKPFANLTRREMYEVVATEENSDSVRDTLQQYHQYSTRRGMGLNLPYGTLRVNNS